MEVKKMNKGYIIGGAVVLVILLVVGFILAARPKDDVDLSPLKSVDMAMFKSPSCGCCSVYSDYISRKVANLKINQVDDIEKVKRDAGVPANLESWHTSFIGDYFIEGHVPAEAIAKLMTEKPNITGIAMAGMPQGSPGMPGSKRGDFVIYAVNQDGSSVEFMR